MDTTDDCLLWTDNETLKITKTKHTKMNLSNK